MKILLFRFEWDKIHFLECNTSHENFILGIKEKISLESSLERWEKYKKVLDELLLLTTKYSPDLFVYHSPQKYMWKIIDSEWFALWSILNLFTFTQDKKIIELTPSIVRSYLNIPQKDFKVRFEQTKELIIKNYNIVKSDRMLEGLVYLYLIKPV